ncbi:hypothetical protein OG225_03180 [Nocardia sp. NBC_01377]|uniref:hypothetical protein n=1 Tax=Nocardia sp. NBC_01377 TaxID=2903595 RepID=UPI0032472BE6
MSTTDLDEAVKQIRDQVIEWKKMPDEINDTFDKLKVLSFALWWKLTDERDKANEHIQKLLDKLDEIMDGIDAPYLFIGYAADWQTVAGTIRGAKNTQNQATFILDGHWTGDAQLRYAASRTLQDTAMGTTQEMAEKVHEQLLKLAESGRNLYKAVVDAIGEFLTNIGSALVQIMGLVTAIEGASLMVDAAFSALDSANKLYTLAFNEIQGHKIAANELINLTDNPNGLPNNQWPVSVSTTFEDPKLWKQTE